MSPVSRCQVLPLLSQMSAQGPQNLNIPYETGNSQFTLREEAASIQTKISPWIPLVK